MADQTQPSESNQGGAESASDIPYASPATEPKPPVDLHRPIGRYDFAVIAVRLMAIYLVTMAIPSLAMAVISVSQGDDGPQAHTYSYVTALGAGGMALWFLAPALSKLILTGADRQIEQGQSVRGVHSAQRLFTTLVGVTGVLLISQAIPYLASLLSYYIGGTPELRAMHTREIREFMIVLFLYSAGGAFLFFRAGWLGQRWRMTMTKPGTTEPESAESGGDTTGPTSHS